MLKFSKFAAIAVLGLVAASPAFAQDKTAADKPATPPTVNGVVIPQERIDVNVKAALSQGQQDTPELRNMVRDRVIDLELLSQEAIKQGMDKQADVQQQMEITRQNILAGALIQEFVKNNPISDAAIKEGYDKFKEGMGSKEFDIRHILVKTEAEAKSVEAKLKKGAKFEKLAKELSQDAGSKDNGGDLGWVPAGNIATAYVKPFADAVMALKKGQTSAPVQSQFGWHIIQIKDERNITLPTLDELKPKITQRLQSEAVKKYIADLRDKAKIE
jgi:peptidyl-prolyl cis-trans isomerase C